MTINQLHTGARWLFRLRAYSTLFFTIIIIAIWGRPFVSIITSFSAPILAIIIISILLTLIFAEIYARLAYRFWKYEPSTEGIKIERGIIWKKYSSIPYERVQNVDITRGIFARILGFSTVQIETAGANMGANYGRRRSIYQSEGSLPALSVADAESLRTLILKRVKNPRGKSQGL